MLCKYTQLIESRSFPLIIWGSVWHFLIVLTETTFVHASTTDFLHFSCFNWCHWIVVARSASENSITHISHTQSLSSVHLLFVKPYLLFSSLKQHNWTKTNYKLAKLLKMYILYSWNRKGSHFMKIVTLSPLSHCLNNKLKFNVKPKHELHWGFPHVVSVNVILTFGLNLWICGYLCFHLSTVLISRENVFEFSVVSSTYQKNSQMNKHIIA